MLVTKVSWLIQDRWHLLRRTENLFWDLFVSHVCLMIQALSTLHPVCAVGLLSVCLSLCTGVIIIITIM